MIARCPSFFLHRITWIVGRVTKRLTRSGKSVQCLDSAAYILRCRLIHTSFMSDLKGRDMANTGKAGGELLSSFWFRRLGFCDARLREDLNKRMIAPTSYRVAWTDLSAALRTCLAITWTRPLGPYDSPWFRLQEALHAGISFSNKHDAGTTSRAHVIQSKSSVDVSLLRLS